MKVFVSHISAEQKSPIMVEKVQGAIGAHEGHLGCIEEWTKAS